MIVFLNTLVILFFIRYNYLILLKDVLKIMKWTEVQVSTSPENEDIVSDILYETGAMGLTIEDPRDIIELSKRVEDWDFIDASLFDLKFEGVIIKAYFAETEDLVEIIKIIKDNIEIGPTLLGDKPLGQVIIAEVDEKDWAENWKKYYKPKRIGENIVIKPSWESFQSLPNDLIIELDPGMAFGTGTHETTILCIEALESYVRPDSTVFDIGCGSGVLSIAAAKLGAHKVIGVDIDNVSVKVSNENIKINNVEDIVEIRNGNLLEVITNKANIIVANIIAEIIAGMAKDIDKFLEEDGIFITSGIILEKIYMVEEALIQNGFKILEVKKMNAWACIIASKN